MKAITIHQPWATLIAIGAKQYETRSWSTQYRGPLAIHAGKNQTTIKGLARQAHRIRRDGLDYPPHEFLGCMASALESCGYYPNKLTWAEFPLGAVVAIARLVDVISTNDLEISTLAFQERKFGDFSHGRFGWLLSDVQFLHEPILAHGKQGLWEWKEDLLRGNGE